MMTQTMTILLVFAIAVAGICQANPKISSSDGDLVLHIEREKDLIFQRTGDFSTGLTSILSRLASAEDQVNVVTDTVENEIRSTLQDTVSQSIASMNSTVSVMSQTQQLVNEMTSSSIVSLTSQSESLAGNASQTNRAVSSLVGRVNQLTTSVNAAFSSEVVANVTVNVTRKYNSGFTSFTRHRCIWRSGNPNGGRSKTAVFTGGRCITSNTYSGTPVAGRGCEAFPTGTSQSGPDADYIAWRPDEAGGIRMTWTCGSDRESPGGCTATPTIHANYMCFGAASISSPVQSSSLSQATCAGSTCTAEEYENAALEGARSQLGSVYPTQVNGYKRISCSVEVPADAGTSFHRFSNSNCTGNEVPTGLCDAVQVTLSNGAEVSLDAQGVLPIDRRRAGVSLVGRDSASPATLATVTYYCYGDVNVSYNVIQSQQPNYYYTRCSVPSDNRFIRPSGRSSSNSNQFYHTFGESDCTNGIPQGDCDALISRMAQVGEDEGYMAYVPSDGTSIDGSGPARRNAGVGWIVATPGSTAPPDIAIGYLCYRQQPTRYTRHICTTRSRSPARWTNSNCVCRGSRCSGRNMSPRTRENAGATCDGFFTWRRQYNRDNYRGDEDWIIQNSGATSWWNTHQDYNGYIRTIYYCYN